MTETLTLIIDGLKISAEKGQTVLQAALDADIYIPHLCHHPELSSYGGCRMCIVSVEGERGLPAACTLEVREGMQVKTYGPRIDRVRMDNLELIISEHPTDCLFCSKNRRCELQKVAAFMGFSHLTLRRSKQKHPISHLSPLFYLDRNYCILCSRCVRACQELAGMGVIDLVNRGHRTHVGTFSGEPIDESICRTCLKCLEKCPVAALRPGA